MDGVRLTLAEVVLVSENLEPYVLTFQPDGELDGAIETYALLVMKRAGGVLLAVPSDAIPQEILDLGGQETADGIFGPSTEVAVPGVVLDNGILSPTGEELAVVLVDCTLDVLPLLSYIPAMAEINYGFDEDQPFALPAPEPLLEAATQWISVASGRLTFYSAESEEEAEIQPPKGGRKQRKKPGGAEPMPSGKGTPRGKRPTLASVSATLEQLMQAIPQLTSQVQHISDRQEKFETRLAGSQLGPKSALGEPLGATFSTPQTNANLGALAKDLPPPPRTASQPSVGTLAPLMNKPKNLPRAGGREAGGRAAQPDKPGTSCLGTESGFDDFGISDSSCRTRSHDRPVNSGCWDQHQRCPRTSPSSKRAGDAPGDLFHCGVAGNVEENGTYKQLRDDPRSDDGSRDLWHPLPGTVWGLWTPPRMGSTSVSSHDCFGLSDAGQHPSGEGHHRFAGCDHRTGGARPWKAGDCQPTLSAGGCAGGGLHVPSGGGFVSKPFFRPSGGSEVDNMCVSFHEGDGCYHKQTPGICGCLQRLLLLQVQKIPPQRSDQRAVQRRKVERTNPRERRKTLRWTCIFFHSYPWSFA